MPKVTGVRIPKALADLPGMMHGVKIFTQPGYYIRTRRRCKNNKKKEQAQVPELVTAAPSPAPASNGTRIPEAAPVLAYTGLEVDIQPLTPSAPPVIPPFTQTEETHYSREDLSVAAQRVTWPSADELEFMLNASSQMVESPQLPDLLTQIAYAPPGVGMGGHYDVPHDNQPIGSGDVVWNLPEVDGFRAFDMIDHSEALGQGFPTQQTTMAYPANFAFDHNVYPGFPHQHQSYHPYL